MRRLLALLLLLTACKFAEEKPSATSSSSSTPAKSASSAPTIRVKGSETMRGLAIRLGGAYKDAKLAVDGGGSSAGLAALLSGGADVATSSRLATPEERAAGLRETPVAYDTIAFYVHEMNPVHELTMQQLGGIVTRKITNWREVGGVNAPIAVYGEAAARGVTTYLGVPDVPPQPTRDYTDPKGVLAALEADPAGLGYTGLSAAPHTRLLWIRRADGVAVAPTPVTIRDRSYPLSGRFYLYSKADAPEPVRKFVAWAASPAAKKAVEDSGYVQNAER
ncbi:MAG TPA: substrate-binding domain-containing protein [Thermoanaerobaculia bacterium]|jgi:phosphate transport system substrate-binding protein|nr:substrate-binding domain-containing protein [Thermoanaerobaculia bacterium]